MTYPFVEVVWTDANRISGWGTLDDLPVPTKVKTRGWVLHDDDSHMTLAGSLAEGSREMGECLAIPRGMIEEVTYLDRGVT